STRRSGVHSRRRWSRSAPPSPPRSSSTSCPAVCCRYASSTSSSRCAHACDARRQVRFFLRTDRLVLRRFTAADVDNPVALDADPKVMRLLTGGKPTPRDVIEHELLPAWLQDYGRFASFGRWAALDRGTGEFIGWFALQPRDAGSGDEVELGYRLRRSAW